MDGKALPLVLTKIQLMKNLKDLENTLDRKDVIHSKLNDVMKNANIVLMEENINIEYFIKQILEGNIKLEYERVFKKDLKKLLWILTRDETLDFLCRLIDCKLVNNNYDDNIQEALMIMFKELFNYCLPKQKKYITNQLWLFIKDESSFWNDDSNLWKKKLDFLSHALYDNSSLESKNNSKLLFNKILNNSRWSKKDLNFIYKIGMRYINLTDMQYKDIAIMVQEKIF